jgi:hypothetical protein
MHSILHTELVSPIGKLKRITQQLSSDSLVNFVWTIQKLYVLYQAMPILCDTREI